MEGESRTWRGRLIYGGGDSSSDSSVEGENCLRMGNLV
jgi:hypothetical protein